MLEEYPDVLTVPEIREILYIGRNKAYQLLDFVERTKGNATEGKRKQPLVQKAKEMVTTTFNRRLKKCCDEFGIPYRSSHKIRFSTASIMYEKNVKPTEIQKLLGHTTLAMTLHYLRSNTPQEEIKSVMEDIFG